MVFILVMVVFLIVHHVWAGFGLMISVPNNAIIKEFTESK